MKTTHKGANFNPLYLQKICRVLSKHGDIYTLQDMNYQTRQVKKNVLLQEMLQKKVYMIDLKISKSNKLLSVPVDLDGVCYPISMVFSDEYDDELKYKEPEFILFYGLAYINSTLSSEKKHELINKLKNNFYLYHRYNYLSIMELFDRNEKYVIDYFWKQEEDTQRQIIDFIYYMVDREKNSTKSDRPPVNVKEANKWLKRIKSKWYKFSSIKGKDGSRSYIFSQLTIDEEYYPLIIHNTLEGCIDNASYYYSLRKDWM